MSDPEGPPAPRTPEKEVAKAAPQPTEPEKANPTPPKASQHAGGAINPIP